MEELKQLDTDLLLFINRTLTNDVLDFICPILREKKTWIPLYIILAITLYIQKKKEAILWIGAALVLVLISDQTSLFTKNYFHRLRPCNNPELQNLILLRLENCSKSFSFFSNHATNHFAQAVLYSLIFRKWFTTLFFFLWAAAICFSQVYVGIHYPSDIAAGALWGITLGLCCFNATEYLSKKFFNQTKPLP